MFSITTNKTSGDVYMCALTASSGSGRVWGKNVRLASIGEWVHLKIEVFTGDAATTLAKVYVNGELILVTNNYKGYRTTEPSTPSSDTSNANFYTYSAGDGTIHVDNVSFGHNITPIGNDEITDPRPAYKGE